MQEKSLTLTKNNLAYQINTPLCKKKKTAPPPYFRLTSKNVHSCCWAAMLVFCGWAVSSSHSTSQIHGHFICQII